jgi:YbgC/YbaW family acyl-CoA thioester hydrolase
MTHAEFQMTRRVTFAETDLAGVMHFANYYRWMEEVEHAFWRSRGMCVIQEHDGKTYSWPRVITSCEYFAPAHFEDEVEMHLTITDVSEKSLTYEVLFTLGGTKLARGRTKAVCCTMKDGSFKSTPIPEFISARLAKGPA